MDSAAELMLHDGTRAMEVPYRFPEPPDPVARRLPRVSALPDLRRSVNVGVALALLLLCAPLMLLIAVLVKLSSPGPVIFRQKRVGLDRRSADSGLWKGRRGVNYGGRLFTIYKFRTMRMAADPSPEIWAVPNDSRVTPVGRVLRKYRLDELPQLFNVLKGDMNVVGPRPEQPTIFLDLRERVENYGERQRVLPGITGWAQINQSYDTCVEDVCAKVRYDLEYIRQQSLWTDLRVLARTVPVVIRKYGAW